ncbi:MAG TPA: thiol-disulfide oxidoreductase ResA [Bacillota bacterium]|nr:thiol-disulfide oxidoreductase ResA [Bacillota bacterium]
MKGSRTIIRILILAIIFAGVGLAIYNEFLKDKAAVKVGVAAPDFVLKTLDGDDFQLSKYRGKGVVLNFWGSWCDPCKEEMPALEKTFQSFKDKGIVLVGVNIGESDVSIHSFKDRFGLNFPIAMDSKKEITLLYEIGPIPTTYFIDKDGIVKKVVIGGPMSEQTISNNMKEIVPE